MDRGIDRTTRLAFHNTVSCLSACSFFINFFENDIREVLSVSPQMLGFEPGRDVTTRDDGLLLKADLIGMGAFRHWICLGELEFVFRILKILAWKQAMDRA